jgi:hypothetical protein
MGIPTGVAVHTRRHQHGSASERSVHGRHRVGIERPGGQQVLHRPSPRASSLTTAFRDTVERLKGLERDAGKPTWHQVVSAGGRFQA